MSDCLSEYTGRAFTILRNFLPSHFLLLRLRFKFPPLPVKGDKESVFTSLIVPLDADDGRSDDGALLTEAVEGGRPFVYDVGVVDCLRLRGTVCMGDARLRFLLDNSNRQRRVLGMQGFADVDGDSFCLRVTGERDDLSLR